MKLSVFGTIEEVRLPEDDERSIQYRDGYSVIMYVDFLGDYIFEELSNMKAGAFEGQKNELLLEIEKDEKDQEKAKEKADSILRRDMASEAFSKYKFEVNRNNL